MILGVDPGLTGAVGMLSSEAADVNAFDMPVVGSGAAREVDAAALAQRLRSVGAVLAVVENVHAMPSDSARNAFRFGHAYGAVRGVLGALEVPVLLVAPAKWKRDMRVPASKDAARAVASRLLPAGAHLWPLKKHDGRAEAALLALWGARQASHAVGGEVADLLS